MALLQQCSRRLHKCATMHKAHHQCVTKIRYKACDVCPDACCKLQETQARLHDIQHALQSSQDNAQSLQTRLDAATQAKQEAEALCLHLGDQLRKLQGQLAGTHHSMTLFQSQQLELQVLSC